MSVDKEAIRKKIREGVTDPIPGVFPDTVKHIAVYNHGTALPQDSISSAEIMQAYLCIRYFEICDYTRLIVSL